LDALHDRRRRYAMLLVVLPLRLAPAVRLLDGALHGARDPVGIHDGAAARIACGTADRLDERALVAQKPFLVRIENRDERHLRKVEPLAQQVDADEYLESAQPQIPQNLHALDRVD